MKVDLHTHTSVSDGKLTVTELIELAKNRRIDMLSITDHDTVAGYRDLETVDTGNLAVIPGIEFSTQWQGVGIHIVGLNIELQHGKLLQGIEFQTRARQERAVKIASRLQKELNIDDPLPAVMEIASNNNVGRPHFARHLLNIGAADSMESVFKKYLGSGKLGDVKETWATLPQVIEWITGSGGTAVLAHPLKYKLTRTRLLKLLDEFRELGGNGMEVVNGQQKPEETDKLATVCNARHLLASCGSDFHSPDHAWAGIGDFSKLPEICTPVWEHWNNAVRS